MGDLLGGSGAVDADRNRPEADQRQVGQPVFGPVGHHQQDAVATADTEGRVPGGEAPGPLVDLPPAERRPAPVRLSLLPGEPGEPWVLAGVAGQELGQGPVGRGVGQVAGGAGC